MAKDYYKYSRAEREQFLNRSYKRYRLSKKEQEKEEKELFRQLFATENYYCSELNNG